MSAEKLYLDTSYLLCKKLTQQYSTSFSWGISQLGKSIQKNIYAIYAMARIADEIVDTFHEVDKANHLMHFKEEVNLALKINYSTNLVLHAFQETVHQFNIDRSLIEAFFVSMEKDIYQNEHNKNSYEEYIYGSAEVIGLMCLHVFVDGNKKQYLQLKPHAQALGSAFQKVNFLRDLKQDYQDLGRIYFPSVDIKSFNEHAKIKIIDDINADFEIAFQGIKQLPNCARKGVYLAYRYYLSLLHKISVTNSVNLLRQRIRINNFQKFLIYLRVKTKLHFSKL